MAVPAHDQRDFDFAKKFDLEIIPVVDPENESIDVNDLKEAFVAEGKLINSGKFNGMDSNLALTEIIEYIKEKKLGREAINYRLRDWLISRQRYWGTPIPMIYCDCCGWVPEKKENLPVILPKDVEFTGKGESPLAGSTAFAETVCPECGKKVFGGAGGTDGIGEDGIGRVILNSFAKNLIKDSCSPTFKSPEIICALI